jgi:hypothetical protein
MNSLQDLLDQYTKNINVDNRVFSRDVMSKDAFSQPFNAWVDNTIDTYVKPEFTRYTYNPAIKNINRQLYDSNQNMGLSGAWRNAGANADLSDMAYGGQLQKEQLLRDYGDMTMGIRDQFENAWVNPLYASQMTDFYNAPWRNMYGGQPQSQSQPQATSGGWNPQSPQQGGYRYDINPVDASRPSMQNSGLDMGGNRNDLLSRYLAKPKVSNEKSYNLLQNF